MFERYIAYTKDNPQGYWFKRKLYGWGWTPVRWQGWLVIALYLAAFWYFFKSADAVSHSGSDALIGFSVPFVAITAVLFVICYTKGEKPKWQWGIGKK